MSKPDFVAYLDHYVSEVGRVLDPTPGKLFAQPGGEVAWDQCDCAGQGWARFVSAVPVYGDRKANGRRCVTRWDATFAVGVLRCVQSPTQKGQIVRLPTGAQITEDGHTFARDLVALMGMVECDQYVDSMIEALPLGPDGGCAGSEVRFTVRVQPCCE